MELKQLTVTEFAALLGSDAPAPGGGSTAALEGALGAALTAMVCALTLGKKKYAEHQELASRTLEEARTLQTRFLELMDEDTRTFGEMSAAFALPKSTEEEKAARSAAIQRALARCTEAPFAMMELAAQTLELASAALGKTNASALSDLGVSALSLGSAIRGAWLNVLINTGSMKDTALAESYRSRGRALLDRALPLADAIYRGVEEQL